MNNKRRWNVYGDKVVRYRVVSPFCLMRTHRYRWQAIVWAWLIVTFVDGRWAFTISQEDLLAGRPVPRNWLGGKGPINPGI